MQAGLEFNTDFGFRTTSSSVKALRSSSDAIVVMSMVATDAFIQVRHMRAAIVASL
jgi:hypothetical protein